MKLIEPTVYEIVEQNPLKRIELAGRTCYKSSSEFNEKSAIKFCCNLVNRKHYAMLEHGEFTVLITAKRTLACSNIPNIRWARWSDLGNNKYVLTLSFSHLAQYQHIVESADLVGQDEIIFLCSCALAKAKYLNVSVDAEVTGLLDPLEIEISLIEDTAALLNFSMDIYKKHANKTFKFICDRGVSHELVRHRCAVAQESQRYCNYSKDKFGNEVTFIRPSAFGTWTQDAQKAFIAELTRAESCYLSLLESGLTPQQARAVLPNATKTEVILTMPIQQWEHFIDLRSRGTTGDPHPDMKLLADKVAQSVLLENSALEQIKL